MISSSFITSQVFNIEVFDSSDLYSNEEEVRLEVYDQFNSIDRTVSSEELFFNNTTRIGREKCNEVKINDAYAAKVNTELDCTGWFKKRRSWKKQYKTLLEIKDLPRDICRHIISFLREPRSILITDCGSKNSTLIGLTLGNSYDLRKGQKYRLPINLDLLITQQSCLTRQEDQTVDEIKKKIEENFEGCHNKQFYYEVSCREDKQHKNFHILCLQANKNEIHQQDFIVVSNRSHANFIIGSCDRANIQINWAMLDDYQCEINLHNGIWSINDQKHQKTEQKTWLNLKSEPNMQINIAKYTEIYIGKTLVKVLFGAKK